MAAYCSPMDQRASRCAGDYHYGAKLLKWCMVVVGRWILSSWEGTSKTDENKTRSKRKSEDDCLYCRDNGFCTYGLDFWLAPLEVSTFLDRPRRMDSVSPLEALLGIALSDGAWRFCPISFSCIGRELSGFWTSSWLGLTFFCYLLDMEAHGRMGLLAHIHHCIITAL